MECEQILMTALLQEAEAPSRRLDLPVVLRQAGPPPLETGGAPLWEKAVSTPRLKRQERGLMAVAALVLALGLAVPMMVFGMLHESVENASPTSTEPAASVHDPRHAVAGFLNSLTVAKRSQFVCEASRLLPLMEAYYQRRPTPEPIGLERLAHHQADFGFSTGHQYELVTGWDDLGRRHHFIVQQQPNGSYLLDWECAVGYNPVPTDTFLHERPNEAVTLRVGASWTREHLAAFGNRHTHQGVALRAQDLPNQTLYGYVRRHSLCYRELSVMLNGRAGVPLMLRVRLPEAERERLEPALEILELIQPHWLGADRPSPHQNIALLQESP